MIRLEFISGALEPAGGCEKRSQLFREVGMEKVAPICAVSMADKQGVLGSEPPTVRNEIFHPACMILCCSNLLPGLTPAYRYVRIDMVYFQKIYKS